MRPPLLRDREIDIILALAGQALPLLAICRRLGMSSAQLRAWRRRAARLPTRWHALAVENARLRRRVADLALDKAVLRHAVLTPLSEHRRPRDSENA